MAKMTIAFAMLASNDAEMLASVTFSREAPIILIDYKTWYTLSVILIECCRMELSIWKLFNKNNFWFNCYCLKMQARS